MISYAESIMRPEACVNVQFIECQLNDHRMHAEQAVATGNYIDHETYNMSGDKIVDKSYRDSVWIIPKDDGPLALTFYDKVTEYAKANFNLQPADSIRCARFEFFAYPAGNGLKMHIDDHSANYETGEMIATNHQRGITAILYVNDDFEGGEIVFPNQELSIKPKPGMLVIFPSNRQFKHGVLPITSGWRYSYQRMFSIVCGATGKLSVE